MGVYGSDLPWQTARMDLDFCRELAVQHKILLQEAGGENSGASLFGVLLVFLFFSSKIFFLDGVLFFFGSGKNNLGGKSKVYLYPILLLVFIDSSGLLLVPGVSGEMR